MAIKYSTIGGSTGTGFNVQVGSKYSYATFTTAQPAGAYTIKSSNNYTNWDVYLLDASNNLVAYTGSASISPVSAFSAIVVVNGTVNDILQFSFQSTVFATATTSQTKAGPFITAFGSSVIPNQNSAVTITGGNFAVGITATFTGTDSVVRTCKSVVYNSNTSISVVRPDTLPVGFAPYTLTLTNPGVNNPATSNANILTGLTVGAAPTWTTGTSLATASAGTAYTTTVVATDPDVGGSISYSYVSGTLPTGLSFNSGTGVISGTYSGLIDGTTSYTIRATDSGGNFTDRAFTIPFTGVSGGTLVTSDATYYYRVFTGNGTFSTGTGLVVDVMSLGGGGGGGTFGGGGGAGGIFYASSQTLSANAYTVTVGGSGAGAPAPSDTGINGTNGLPSQFGSLTAALGGGGGGSRNSGSYTFPYLGNIGNAGGCGGGGAESDAPYTGAIGGASNQSSTGGTGYGNAGGQGASNGFYKHGGGGGTGAVGGSANPLNATGGSAGSGGAGTTAFSAWLTAISSTMSGVSGWASAVSGGNIGGGGGGGNYNNGTNGAGGAGGGGAGGLGTSGNNQVPGTTSTGGGGGGSTYQSAGANGGSGLVIVRYTKSQIV